MERKEKNDIKTKTHIRGRNNGLSLHLPVVGASTPEPEWAFLYEKKRF